MISSPTRRASCPSRWRSLVCKIPIALLGLSETNTIGYYGGYCFLPLHLYEGLSGRLITTIFKAKRCTGTQMLAVLKRLVRKAICFSKTTQMHDIVLGLFVNRYAFGRAV